MYQKLMRRIFKAYLSVKFGVNEFEIPQDAKCLCLSPHQDDESIGMGGTLAKYNKNFTVICLTNGAKGLKTLPKKEESNINQESVSNGIKEKHGKKLIQRKKLKDLRKFKEKKCTEC